MYWRCRLGVALSIALGGGMLTGVSDVRGQAAQPQALPRVEVTGTSIKRVQVEGPVPVEVYTRREIERTGATTVNEVLRSIASLDLVLEGESIANSPSVSGATPIKMRGLDETGMLVLLNGRRMALNALQDGTGLGAAVDLNMLPLSAIERIEILKDGASAIYGADAVAGVINFITRKRYAGLEMSASYGDSTQGGGAERRGGLTAGHGDLARDGYNILAGVDVFRRDPIYRRDRKISRSSDFRRFGGPDGRSSRHPSGNFIDPDTGSPIGGSVRPCPPGEVDASNVCRYDFNADLLTAYNGADRIGGLLLGTARLPGNMTLSGELLLSHAEDSFQAHPAPGEFTTADGEWYGGRFMQGGPRLTDRQSDQMQLSFGLEGRYGELDWDVDVGEGRSKVSNREANYFNRAEWEDAVERGAIDPTLTTNDPALVESLKVEPSRVGKSTVTFMNAKVSGEFGELPGGAVGFAVGTSVWREKLVDTPDALSQAGGVLGGIQQAAVDASRRMYAVFGELALPFTRELEGQFALRYDHYPIGSRTSPKLALKYDINPAFSLRGSYSRSFRAPTLKQLYGGSEEGAGGFEDPVLCAAFNQPEDCFIEGVEVGGSSPDLKPEKGTTFNLGVIAEPAPGLSVSLDWWLLKIKDKIDTPTVGEAVALGDFGRRADGKIFVNVVQRNYATARNEGLDLDFRWNLGRTSIGALTLRNTSTYYLHQLRKTVVDSAWDERNGTYLKPRWRNVLSLDLDAGDWQGTAAVRAISGFRDTDEPDERSVARRVAGHEEVDLLASFTGIRNLKIDFGIKNVFDREPPFSRLNALSPQYSQMGFAELYSSRGRFIFGGVAYRFH